MQSESRRWLVLCFACLSARPKNVYVFDDSMDMSSIQNTVDTVFAENGGNNPPNNGQWSNDRYALMFTPGTYQVNVQVGYYTSVYGLGTNPKDTDIANVLCQNGKQKKRKRRKRRNKTKQNKE